MMYSTIPVNLFTATVPTVGLLTPEIIREFRHTRHLTQQQLANLLGVGLATVNRWERGDTKPSGTSELVLNAAIAKAVQQKQATVAATEKASTEIVGKREIESTAFTKATIMSTGASIIAGAAAAYGVYSLLKEVFEPSSDK